MAILTLTLVVTAYSFTIAQVLKDKNADPEMKRKVVRAIEGKENGWEAIEYSPVGRKSISSIYRNKNVEGSVDILVIERDTVEEASHQFALTRRSISGGFIRDEVKYGDEAFMVIGMSLRGASLNIRSGSVLITVSAPSEELATRFAKHLLKEFAAQ